MAESDLLFSTTVEVLTCHSQLEPSSVVASTTTSPDLQNRGFTQQVCDAIVLVTMVPDIALTHDIFFVTSLEVRALETDRLGLL